MAYLANFSLAASALVTQTFYIFTVLQHHVIRTVDASLLHILAFDTSKVNLYKRIFLRSRLVLAILPLVFCFVLRILDVMIDTE